MIPAWLAYADPLFIIAAVTAAGFAALAAGLAWRLYIAEHQNGNR